MNSARIGVSGMMAAGLLWMFCMLWTAGARAGESDPAARVSELETVTVTASKIGTDVSRTPTNISVVSREEIERHPSATNIFELLSQVNVPGVFIPRLPGSLPVDGKLSTRGSESTPWAVRILVNGIEFNKGNGYIVPPRIPMHDIERIEIVKTPSAVYGDQAIYGVINIITRVSDKPLEARTGISFDSYGSTNAHVVLNGSKEKWEYFLDASMVRFNGFQDRAFEDDNTLYTRIGYHIDDTSSLVFHGSHYDADANYANALTFEQLASEPQQNPGADMPLDDDYQIYALAYDKAFGRHSLSVKLDVKDEITKMFFSGLHFEFDEWEVHPEAAFTLRHDLGEMDNTLVMGAEFRYHELDTLLHLAPDNLIGAMIGDRHREDTTCAFYVQDQLRITRALTMTAGLRYDDYEQDQTGRVNTANTWTQSNSHLSPKLGITYTFSPGVNLFAGFNSGFKSPARVPGAAASDSLSPEKINAYEIGIRGIPAGWLSYEMAVFYHQVKDKIASVAPQQLENVGETDAKGIEASINAEFPNGFYMTLGYTYQDATFKDYQHNGVSYNGNTLPNVPEHILGTWLGYRHKALGDIALNPTYHGSMALNTANTLNWGGYWLLGARYTKRFDTWPGIEFFIAGENLTDETEVSQSANTNSTPGAEEVYPVPGLRIATGVKFVF